MLNNNYNVNRASVLFEAGHHSVTKTLLLGKGAEIDNFLSSLLNYPLKKEFLLVAQEFCDLMN